MDDDLFTDDGDVSQTLSSMKQAEKAHNTKFTGLNTDEYNLSMIACGRAMAEVPVSTIAILWMVGVTVLSTSKGTKVVFNSYLIANDSNLRRNHSGRYLMRIEKEGKYDDDGFYI